MSKILVAIKEPGIDCIQVGYIENELETLQRLVGGYIEPVYTANYIAIVDEDGVIKGKPYCCTVGGSCLFGTVVFVGVQGEDFPPLDGRQIETVAKEVLQYARR